jgi:hypothetical protein
MKLTKETLEHIVEEVERIQYGKVTICISETSGTIDVVAEERTQFRKAPAPGIPVDMSRPMKKG